MMIMIASAAAAKPEARDGFLRAALKLPGRGSHRDRILELRFNNINHRVETKVGMRPQVSSPIPTQFFELHSTVTLATDSDVAAAAGRAGSCQARRLRWTARDSARRDSSVIKALVTVTVS